MNRDNFHWWLIGALLFVLLVVLPIRAFGQSSSRHDAVRIRGSRVQKGTPTNGWVLTFDSDSIYWKAASSGDTAHYARVLADDPGSPNDTLLFRSDTLLCERALRVDGGINLGGGAASHLNLGANRIVANTAVNLDCDADGDVDLQITDGGGEEPTIIFYGAPGNDPRLVAQASGYLDLEGLAWLRVGTGYDSVGIQGKFIEPDEINSTNSPTDNYCLRYDADSAKFYWAADSTAAGSGGTAVWESLYVHIDTIAVLYDKIDTTSAKIPTATLADSTDGGAIRATTAAYADSAGNVTNQSIGPWDVDSTLTDYVFGGAYHITSAEADSEFATIYGAREAAHDTVTNWSDHPAVSKIATAGYALTTADAGGGEYRLYFDLNDNDTNSSYYSVFWSSTYGWQGQLAFTYGGTSQIIGRLSGARSTIDLDADTILCVANVGGITGETAVFGLMEGTLLRNGDFVGYSAPVDVKATYYNHPPDSNASASGAMFQLTPSGTSLNWGYVWKVDSAAVSDSANGGAIRAETAKGADTANTATLADAATYADSATASNLKSYASPTVDAEGEIAWDSGDDAIEVYDGSASRLIPTVKNKEFVIGLPDGYCCDTVPFFDVTATGYPAGIKILELEFATYGSTSDTVFFLELSDMTTGIAVCDTVGTSTSSEATSSGSGIYDADIAAGNWLGVYLQNVAGSDQIHVRVSYYVKDN